MADNGRGVPGTGGTGGGRGVVTRMAGAGQGNGREAQAQAERGGGRAVADLRNCGPRSHRMPEKAVAKAKKTTPCRITES